MSNNSYIICFVSFLITYFSVAIYFMYKNYKKQQLRLHEELAEKDVCLCKHPRWYHMTLTGNTYIRCYEFDDKDLKMCECKAFKLDNLLYLEKLMSK